MPVWATAVIAVDPPQPEPGAASPPPGSGHRPLGSSRLLDAGSGTGQLRFFDPDEWREARSLPAAEGPRWRALRVWDAIVARGRAATVDGWYVSLPAELGTAALDFDDPAVAGALRLMLGSFLPLLGRRLIATSTLMPAWKRCAGAITVFGAASEAEARTLASSDPWQAIFAARLFRLEQAIVSRVPAPAGPGTQRYGGANPWPGGSFA